MLTLGVGKPAVPAYNAVCLSLCDDSDPADLMDVSAISTEDPWTGNHLFPRYQISHHVYVAGLEIDVIVSRFEGDMKIVPHPLAESPDCHLEVF